MLECVRRERDEPPPFPGRGHARRGPRRSPPGMAASRRRRRGERPGRARPPPRLLRQHRAGHRLARRCAGAVATEPGRGRALGAGAVRRARRWARGHPVDPAASGAGRSRRRARVVRGCFGPSAAARACRRRQVLPARHHAGRDDVRGEPGLRHARRRGTLRPRPAPGPSARPARPRPRPVATARSSSRRS